MTGKTRALTEGALMAALSVVLYLVGQVPPLSIILPLLSPIPITWVGVQNGAGAAVQSAMVSTLVCFLLLGPVGAYIYVVPFGAIGVICGALLHMERSSEEVLIQGGLLTCLVLVVGYMGIEQGLGMTEGAEEIQTMLGGILALPAWPLARLVEWAAVDGIDPQIVYALRDATVEILSRLPIGLLFPVAILFVYANHLMSFLIFVRFGQFVVPPAGPMQLRLGRRWVLLVLLLLIVTPAAAVLDQRWLATLLGNGSLVGLFFFYVSGLARLSRWFQDRGWSLAPRLVASFSMVFLFAPLTAMLGMVTSFESVKEDVPVDLKGF